MNNVAPLTKEIDIIKVDVHDIAIIMENMVKSTNRMVKAMERVHVLLWVVKGLIIVSAFCFCIFFNTKLNNIQRAIERFEVRIISQMEDKFNYQNQIYNERFSSMMKESDRNFQLALETLNRVSKPVPSQELSNIPSPPKIGSPPEENQLDPVGEIR